MTVCDLLVALTEVALFVEHTQAIVDEIDILRQHPLTEQGGAIEEGGLIAVGQDVYKRQLATPPILPSAGSARSWRSYRDAG